jgi:tetratricopeptide (TPR) repeat protein
MRKRLKELGGKDASPAALVELGQLAAEARAANDIHATALARALEAGQARILGKHQHAVVVGAELLEMWPELKKHPLPEKDELDVARRVVWGMKYVAGSAMDLPEIPLATTDGVLAVLGEMLTHFGYEPFALWQLAARRAYIAGDDAELKALVGKLASTVTRYNHIYECADCPGCVLVQFVEWMGPDANDAEVEEVLAPCLGKRPFQPDPAGSRRVLDMLFGPLAACENAERTVPVRLARAYLRGGKHAQALKHAERAMAMAEGTEAERRARALVARTAVANALGEAKESEKLARELVLQARALEDAYEQLDALLVAQEALRDPALVDQSLALAARLDARVEKKRHVEATKRALDL